MNKLLWYDTCYSKCWINDKAISGKIGIGLLINNIHYTQQFYYDDIFSGLVVNKKSKAFRIFLVDNAKKHV